MTKEQLEAIWNSSDIGWLKRQAKASKGKEQRRIKITFYNKLPVHTIEDTVWVSKKDMASNFSWSIIHKHFSDSKQWPSGTYQAEFVTE